MRMSSKLILSLLLATSTLTSCGKHHPAAPGEPGAGTTGGGDPGDFYALWRQSAVEGAQFFTTGGEPRTQLVTMDVDGVTMAAAMFEVGSRFVDAGTVRVTQSPPLAAGIDTLARLSVPVYGTPWFLYTSVTNVPPSPPVTFDGVARHRFQVSGSAEIEAFEDSLTSVKPPVLSYPSEGEVIPRGADLIVTWSDAGTDTSVRVFAFAYSDVNGGLAPGIGDARDPDGHAKVDFTHMSLPAGAVRLNVIRYRVAHRTIGGVGVVLKCEGITRRTVTLP